MGAEDETGRGTGKQGPWADPDEDARAAKQEGDVHALDVEGDPRGGVQSDEYRHADPRELGRPRAAADRVRGLEYDDGPALARDRYRGRETVRARADDDRVDVGDQPTPTSDERLARTISRAITRRWISFVPS